jgi:hypothetical protein
MDNERIAAKRPSMVKQATRGKAHRAGFVEMRDGILYLTIEGQNIVWK